MQRAIQWHLTIWLSMTFEKHHVVCNQATTSITSLTPPDTHMKSHTPPLPSFPFPSPSESCTDICACICFVADLQFCRMHWTIWLYIRHKYVRRPHRWWVRAKASDLDWLLTFCAWLQASSSFTTYVFRTCQTANVLHVFHLFYFYFAQNIYTRCNGRGKEHALCHIVHLWICNTLYSGGSVRVLWNRDTTTNSLELQCNTDLQGNACIRSGKMCVCDRGIYCIIYPIYVLHSKRIWLW